jgi:hypothetical protein
MPWLEDLATEGAEDAKGVVASLERVADRMPLSSILRLRIRHGEIQREVLGNKKPVRETHRLEKGECIYFARTDRRLFSGR